MFSLNIGGSRGKYGKKMELAGGMHNVVSPPIEEVVDVLCPDEDSMEEVEEWRFGSSNGSRSVDGKEIASGSYGRGSENDSSSVSGSGTDRPGDMKSYPHCPVFILSKGRFDLDRDGTISNFVRDLVPFVVVVEKEEEEGYSRLLDSLVFRFFGEVVIDASTSTGEKKEEETNEDELGNSQAKKRAKVGKNKAGEDSACQKSCFCCSDRKEGRNSFVRVVSKAYHHGYVLSPLQKKEETPEFRSPAFTLHTIDDIRQLFRIEILPESSKGILYVRNYILHVLTPRLMNDICMDDSADSIDELDMLAPNQLQGLSESVLRRWNTPSVVFDALEKRRNLLLERKRTVSPVHPLFGYYWVLDDDIYSFVMTRAKCGRNKRLSPREMILEVERRVVSMRKCGKPSVSSVPSHGSIFTCKEEALANNFISSSVVTAGALSTSNNFDSLANTAIISLEYGRFCYYETYDDDAISVNSYNTIACLFRYDLMHLSMTNTTSPNVVQHYYPLNAYGVRSPADVFVGYAGNMLWYRFGVREDYDFTLQLIARGLCTVRFRQLGFDVPQMAKVRGGLTDYYKNCQDEIIEQNKRFVEQWPSVAQRCMKGKNSSRREDIRIRWDLLHPSRVRYPGAFLFLKELLPQIAPIRLEDETITPTSPNRREPVAHTDVPESDTARMRADEQILSSSGSKKEGIQKAGGEKVGQKKSSEKEKNDRDSLSSSSTASSTLSFPFPTDAAVSSAGGGKISPSLQDSFAKGRTEENEMINLGGEGKGSKRILVREETKKDGNLKSGKPRVRSTAEKTKENTQISLQERLDSKGREPSIRKKRKRSSSESARSASNAPPVDSTSSSASSSASSVSSSRSSSAIPPLASSSTLIAPLGHSSPSKRAQPSSSPPSAVLPIVDKSNEAKDESSWKGFTVIAWREIRPFEAATLGLHHIPSSELRTGRQVAIIPPDFVHSPSVMIATLIDKNVTVARWSALCATYPNQEEEVILWTVVVNKIRGVPLLTVVDCYEVPPIEEMETIISRVDSFFQNAIRNPVVTSMKSSFLDDK